MISSPDGATVHSSFLNSTVVVPSSCTIAGPTMVVHGGRAALAEGREAQLGALADEAEPHVHHLDRLLGRMVRVAVLVERIECGADRLAVSGLELCERHRHRQGEFLPDIAQIEL